MQQKTSTTKIRTERIECFYAKGSGKARDYHFYIDFPRKASREEEATRKAFIKAIKQYETTEGRGYNWRVNVWTLRAAVDFLPDPTAIKAEMQRFDREGVRPPSEPYHVCRVDVMDTDLPNVIRLSFDHDGPIPECFRRACDYWRANHKQRKGEYQRLDLFGGRSMTITLDMLIAFESWLVFDKPWRELHQEAVQERKQYEQEQKARQWQSDAPFRAKYPDWNKWTSNEQEEVRRKAREELFEHIREHFERTREEYQQYSYRSFSFTSASQVTQAFELFGLPHSATPEEVKRKYRALSKQFHPDMPNGDEAQFKKLNNANEVLVQHLSRSK